MDFWQVQIGTSRYVQIPKRAVIQTKYTDRSPAASCEERPCGPENLIGQFIVLRDVRAELGIHFFDRRVAGNRQRMLESDLQDFVH
jgi:hypothetical protein